MRKLLTALMLVAPLALLVGCHPKDHRHENTRNNDIDSVPLGGVDWGLFNHFEHDFASRSISTSSDQDGFEFSLAEDSVVVITVTGFNGFDGFLDLYDSGFRFVTSDDDGGPGDDPVLVGTLDRDDYVLIVGGSGSSTGDYDVDISVEPLGGSDFGIMLIGDSFIDTGGSVADPFDVDSYIFTVLNDVDADIFLTRFSGDYDGNLELLDEYGQVIAFEDPAGDADPDILNVALTPGTYIVRVGASSGSGEYDMQIDIN